MRYFAVATDYDGTLATHGAVEPDVVSALDRLGSSGRRIILVTGRILSDLARVFPEYERFDAIVAENGGTIWRRGEGERTVAPAASRALVDVLRRRGVPVDAGRVVVATTEPHDVPMLAAVRELGLELQLVFNKGAVMALPSGVNKRTGLEAALAELGLTLHETVAVGDAENDHTMLAAAEVGAAVANALPALKQHADLVLSRSHGAGVVELIDRLVADDLTGLHPPRHAIALGTAPDGPIGIPPARTRLLVTGASGSGKTTYASGVLERLVRRGYQVCVVDPEGDFEGFPGLTPIGTAQRAPSVQEVLALLADPKVSPAVTLLGLPLRDRPRFLASLWPQLQELRARVGRPHWIVLDEAHHMLSRAFDLAPALPRDPAGLLLVTVHPDRIAPEVLRLVDTVVAIGDAAEQKLGSVLGAIDGRPHAVPRPDSARDEALLWRADQRRVVRFAPAAPEAAHRRHRRKYATGDVQEKAFHFRGRDGRLNLRAQNLELFLQIAQGVDDDTWRYHLERGDYARWFRDAIKDDGLAEAAARIGRSPGVPSESRRRIREEVEARYILDEPEA